VIEMENHKHHQCLHAFADGWEIELYSDGKWEKIAFPSFDPILEYRIVPNEGGWLPWYGGECPIDNATLVKYKVADNNYAVYGPYPASSLQWNRDYNKKIVSYRVVQVAEVDPYAELKAASVDPNKQIKAWGGDWEDSDYTWTWSARPENYEIRDKPCKCGAKTTATCPGEFEPGCDLGANEKFVKVVPTIPAKKTKKVRLIAWLGADHVLRHVEEGFITTDGPYRDVFRVPSEDKEIEVEE